jgi:hypothetical protein
MPAPGTPPRARREGGGSRHLVRAVRTSYAASMSRSRTALLAALLPLLAGCAEEALPRPGPLDIGSRGPGGEFQPFADGDDFVLDLLGGRVLGLQLSLRVPVAEPRDPDVEIVLLEGETIMGANLTEFGPYALEAHGDAFVLWEAPTAFQVNTCCFLCRDVTVEARLVDSRGRSFEGAVSGLVTRGSCPDPGDCCVSATDCPVPERTRLCD